MDKVKVLGSLIFGFARAAEKLDFKQLFEEQAAEVKVAPGPYNRIPETLIEIIEKSVSDIDPVRWYPFRRWQKLKNLVIQNFIDPDKILKLVGMEMMNTWFHYSSGHKLIKTGVDFLHYQTSSLGFKSVLKGNPVQIGDFVICGIDLTMGRAIVHSTTPFNRSMECGILIGGMLAPGDLTSVQVSSNDDPNFLQIDFH